MHSHTQKTRESRIRELIARLESGRDVQARDLKIVLSSQQYADYQLRWQEQLELRKAEKPADVCTYESMLQAALFAYAKYEKFGSSAHPRSKTYIVGSERSDQLVNEADRLFEHAIEFLIDAVFRDPNIAYWFDRNLDFKPGSSLSIDPTGMPRVFTSRSLDNLSKGKAPHQKSKRELKLEVLREVLEPFDTVGLEDSDIARGQRLRSLSDRFGRCG